VLSDDLERAKAVLARILESGRSDLEPVEAEDASAVMEVPDESGQPVRWITVRACESVAAMRETAMALEAARVEVRVPPLVPRGEASPGQGARFIVRVAEDDVDRATSILSRKESDAEHGDDPHCPKCGNWNVFEITHELTNLFLGLFGKAKPQQCECLKCHYIGDRSEFV